jgi:hypothetical protein
LGPFTGLSFDVAEFAEYVFLTCTRVIGSRSQPVFYVSTATITGYGIIKKNSLQYFFIALSLQVTNNFFAFSIDIIGVLVQFAAFSHCLPVSLVHLP